jgi:hypothetical protein
VADGSDEQGRTTMSDQRFYAANHKPASRPRQLGEHLWAIRKDGQRLDCELRDHGQWASKCRSTGTWNSCTAGAGRRAR